jgi:hypothetical protein
MTWEPIGEPKLEIPTPTDLPWQSARGHVALPLHEPRTTRCVCELPEGPPVVRLLAHGERVLAIRAPDQERRQHVEVIEADGEHSRTIVGLHGDWAIDERHPMLLGRTPEAELAAWSLAEPELPPILVFNRLNQRELDAVRIVDATSVIVTRPIQVLKGPPPDVLVDVLHIDHYDDVSQWRSLRSRTRVAEGICEGIDRVVLGFDPAGLILAHERELWWGDWYLRERARLDPGPAVLPLQLGARRDGSTWMLTEREGRTELWQLVVGRVEQAWVISDKLVDAQALLVAPDDAAVLVGSSEVACFDGEGRLRWTSPRSGAAVGLIDPQGVALYSDGGTLVCSESLAGPAGERATVWTAPSGIGRLGPLSGSASRIWVGAGRIVFGL